MHDTRTNLLGFAIGQRSDHAWALGTARHHLGEARFLRHNAATVAGWNPGQAEADRAYARWHLAEAGRWRRSFAARTTPAPQETR